MSRRSVSKPGTSRCSRRNAAQHQPGADQQDHRQGHLGHEQGAASHAAGAAAPATAFLQDRVEVQPARPTGRERGRTGGCEDGDPEGEAEHAQVDGALAQEIRDPRGEDEGEEPDASERQGQPEGTADEREEQVLGQELPNQPTPVRPRGGAHGQLRPPRRSRGEEKVGDVRAGDQEDEADRSEQERETVAGVAQEGLVEPLHAGSGPAGFLAAALEDLPGDDRGLGLGRGQA